MRLTKLWKTAESTTSTSCPALYRTDDSAAYVVQGKRLDADTRNQMKDLAPDEDAVYVPADVLEQLWNSLAPLPEVSTPAAAPAPAASVDPFTVPTQ